MVSVWCYVPWFLYDGITDLPNQRSVPPVRATNIAVTKNDAEYTMTIDPWDCEPLDILSIRDQPVSLKIYICFIPNQGVAYGRGIGQVK
jgi:hypothetical protein